MWHFGLFCNYSFGYYFYKTTFKALCVVYQLSGRMATAVRWEPAPWDHLPPTHSYALTKKKHHVKPFKQTNKILLITDHFIWLGLIQLRLSRNSSLPHLLCLQVGWCKTALGHCCCAVYTTLPQRLAAPDSSPGAFRNQANISIFFRQFNQACVSGKMLSAAPQITPKRTDQCNALLTKSEL